MRRLPSPWLNSAPAIVLLLLVISAQPSSPVESSEREEESPYSAQAQVVRYPGGEYPGGPSVQELQQHQRYPGYSGYPGYLQGYQQGYPQQYPGYLPPPCPEASKWPRFCAPLLDSGLLNESSKMLVLQRTPTAIAMFCDMVRVLNRIDCAQPFTVSPRWRAACQDSYRDWSCSTIATDLFPLPPCSSTCHQVIRSCPYTTPDRSQLDRGGRLTPHPSQYGGHPTFFCPTPYHPDDQPHSCIIFSPTDMSYDLFPLTTLDLNLLSFTFCSEMASGSVVRAKDPAIVTIVNVTQCCWTWASALPAMRRQIASTLQSRKVRERENCQKMGLPWENGKTGWEDNKGSGLPWDERNEIVVQCFISTASSSDPWNKLNVNNKLLIVLLLGSVIWMEVEPSFSGT